MPDPAIADEAERFERPFAKLKPGPGRSAMEVADHQRSRIQRATISIVAERGYGALTVRETARLAGVSSKAYYKHFANKEDAFQRTLESISRRLTRRIRASQAGARGSDDAVRLSIQALVKEWGCDPQAAHLALIEANAAGPAALEEVRRMNDSIATTVRVAFHGPSEGVQAPPQSLLLHGIVAGLTSVVRTCLLAGAVQQLPELAEPLSHWALAYRRPLVASLDDLDRHQTTPLYLRAAFMPPVPSSDVTTMEEGSGPPSGDLALLLSAVTRLAATREGQSLSVRKILTTAGVPRRAFYAHFSDIDDCIAVSAELQASQAITQARQASQAGHTAASSVYLAAHSLSARAVHNKAFAVLCLGQISKSAVRRTRVRQTAVTGVGRLIEDLVSPVLDRDLDDVTVKASAGALWGILEHCHSTDARPVGVDQIAATLACCVLALAPRALEVLELEAISPEQVPAIQG